MEKMIKKAGIVTVLAVVGMSAGLCSAAELVVKSGDKLGFLGDSITQQGGNKAGGYVNLVVKGLDANGVKVEPIKAGISGHKSNDMLSRLDRDVISKQANVMTLSCGVNDVWHGARGVGLEAYKSNITAIVDKAQAAQIKVVILTSTLIGDANSENSKKLDAYNDFLRSLAKERNLPLADLNADMKEIMKDKGARAGLTSDGVHMAMKGDEMMAKGVLVALGLSAEQMEKAKDAWLDIPGSSDLNVKITLRQYNKLAEKAAATPGRSVSDYVNSEFLKFLDVETK